MANINNPFGFKNYANARRQKIVYLPAAASLASVYGDTVYFDSAGRITATPGYVAGTQRGPAIDPITKDVVTTVSAGDLIPVDVSGDLMVAQISTFALTDPYTTIVSSDCFDVAGSAGAQYIDAGSSTNDIIKVLALLPGQEVGAYAKVICKYNPSKFMLTSVS